jgi:hypothetical protein
MPTASLKAPSDQAHDRGHRCGRRARAHRLRPEIAQVMLRRRQAVARRCKLVEGAVGMVEMAIIDINEKSLATFTPAQKVALVTNLMTVLVGEGQPQAVVPVMGQQG